MAIFNLHTHTTFCDGRDTPAEMAATAYELGLDILGFSGHAFTSIGQDYSMSRDSVDAYRAAIKTLKADYDGRMQILCGIEQDIFSDDAPVGFDYVIGSVHHVPCEACDDVADARNRAVAFVDADNTREMVDAAVARYFGGDIYAYVERYYRLVSRVHELTSCDIVGHFDLITKFNQGGSHFDTEHPRYVAAAFAALEELVATPVYFEVNYGAITRGYRNEPYPEQRYIDYIRAHACFHGAPLPGDRLVYTSDCHDRRNLLVDRVAEDQPIPAFLL